MHIGIPFAPPGCFLVKVRAITIGVGFRGRFWTIYEKEQASLLNAPAERPSNST